MLTIARLYMGVILAYVCLCSSFTSSIFSASTYSVAAHFGVSSEVATLSTSLYVLGYAFGPLVWGPFSELQGKRFQGGLNMNTELLQVENFRSRSECSAFLCSVSVVQQQKIYKRSCSAASLLDFSEHAR